MKSSGSPQIQEDLDPSSLRGLYEKMVLLREFELAAQKQYRDGRMPGFIHLYVGEEAVAVGVCAHLRTEDAITGTHRGHGHALAKGVAPEKLLAELYGKATGCCGGRGGSMHLYDVVAGLFGTNGFVAAGIPAAAGVGLSAKVQKSQRVVVSFFGDGAVNHGAFHEGINFAAAQNLPVVFVCENNLYATATPFRAVTRNIDVASRAEAYGAPGVAVDGNDVRAVWQTARQAVERARTGGGPTLIEARTYRLVGHHEGDPLVGTYRTQEELDGWKKRCPIRQFRAWLETNCLASPAELDALEQRVRVRIQAAVAFAESSPSPDPATANLHVWSDSVARPLASGPLPPSSAPALEQTWIEAVRDGIAEEMRHDPHLIYLGEGIGERGGSFAHTKGLWHEFGSERVIDTPISELGFTGAALGAAASGCRAVADMMFADFLFEAASQLIHQAAKMRYMSNGQLGVPMVVRAGCGAIKNAGPHHSGCYHPIWAHCPGLLVVIPLTPADAKALMKTALRSADPVIFFEPKLLFGSKGLIPGGEHCLPFGKAKVVLEGKDITLVTCAELVLRCQDAAQRLAREGISCEVIDLRTIVPLDVATVCASVAKTGRLLVVDPGFPMCGIGAEVAASIVEEAFDELDAPIGRLHPDPVAQPFSPSLENTILVSVEKIVTAARSIVAGRALAPRRLSPRAWAQNEAAETHPAAPSLRVGAEAKLKASPAPSEAATGVPVRIPNQDLTVTEATVVRWLKNVGDNVLSGEPLVEVETAKAMVPVESPAGGQLRKIVANVGAVVEMTAVLGFIDPAADAVGADGKAS